MNKNINKKSLFILIFIFYYVLSPVSTIHSKSIMVPANFSELAANARPGVVNIRTVKNVKGGGRVFRHFFGNPFGNERGDDFNDFFEKFFGGNDGTRDYKERSLGSGFLIDKEGYIVTNNHVVENADKIKVKLYDDTEYEAEIVGRDQKTDLALIKIPESKSLKPFNIGDSDKLKVGQWVVAIGSPFGLEQTVTAGIVSAKGRIIGSGPYDDFIQTDASINPGNSGGPLINMEGEVVGINTAIIAGGQGIGFAIPINLAKNIIDQLKTKGEVTRGWLGVAIQDITDELAEYYGISDKKGVLVTEVFDGDPADKAGIKAKDIIVEVDGKKVNSSRELSMAIANTNVGKRTAITVLRNGREKTLYVKIAERTDSKEGKFYSSDETSYDIGFKVRDLSPEIARQFGYKEDESGVVVSNIDPGSKGDEAGLRVGDLIKEINRNSVKDVDSFNKEFQNIKKGNTFHLFIKRSNSGFIVIKMEK